MKLHITTINETKNYYKFIGYINKKTNDKWNKEIKQVNIKKEYLANKKFSFPLVLDIKFEKGKGAYINED